MFITVAGFDSDISAGLTVAQSEKPREIDPT